MALTGAHGETADRGVCRFRRFGVLLVVLGLTLPRLAAAQDAASSAVATAAVAPGQAISIPYLALPLPLDQADAERYRTIFARQERADWRGADREIAKLGDRRLLGHVLAHRYWHPSYRSSFRELRDWLARYADHPQAERLFKLALKRKAKSAAAPDTPTARVERAGNPDQFREADAAHWRAGLAAWQSGNWDAAFQQFRGVANSARASSWTRAAGAYWAARTRLKARQPHEVSSWLQKAAAEPRTFYGQLARRALGMDSAFEWVADRPPTRADFELLLAHPAGQRAFALVQIGRMADAEDELHVLRQLDRPGLGAALLALSQRLRFASLALKFGTRIDAGDQAAALYPLPFWHPQGGFTVDPALLYALIRQESNFDPTARSGSGARGLMQIMPATAAFVVRQTPELTERDNRDLMNPEVNLTLGQAYVDRLLNDETVLGDPLLLAVAYNAGPARAARWREASTYEDDPLLYVELLPYSETRKFVQRVLTNLWIYQERLGKATPTLDAVAAGQRPVLTPGEGDAGD